MGLNFKGLGIRLLGVLLPRTCVHCAEDLPAASERPLCADCLAALERPGPPLCGRCGLPLRSAEVCRSCRGPRPPFDLARSAFLFNPPLRSLLHAFKYSGRRDLARPLALMMASELALLEELTPFRTVLPVPLHPSRERRRGYNQSALLARGLAEAAGLSFAEDLLTRERETRPQVDLKRRERLENVRWAFRAAPGAAGGSFLLVDDVATTLATAGDAARALKEAGAAAAAVFTLAREP
ncbi:MAG TPA: ComF family protein [Elusimicrobiales bacterium]|nr:ComF family protein [Elusimicrobiales bacterium]